MATTQPENVNNEVDFILREYEPKDNKNLIAFNQKVDDFRSFYGLFHVGRNYSDSYDSNLKRYNKGYITVAESKTHDIIGAIQLALKDVIINGTPLKAAYIHELKVNQTYNPSNKLITNIEEKAITENAIISYVNIDSNIEEQKNLFEKAGYTIASHRIINIYQPSDKKGVVSSKNIGDPGIRANFRELSLIQSYLNTKEFYDNQDMLPQNLDEIFKTREYVGTYATETEDGKNIAGMSLFTVPKDNAYGIKRLVMETKNFSNQSYHLLNLGILSLIPAALFYLISNTFNAKPSIAAILAIGLNTGILFGYLKLVKYGRMFSAYEKRGKYVGFFYKGEEKYQKELIEMLFSNLNKLTYEKGFASVSYNIDNKDKYSKYYPMGIKCEGILMTKILRAGYALRELTTNLFYDPRD